MKNYVRVVIECPDNRVIKEEWKKVEEEGSREYNFLNILNSVLGGEQGFIKLITRSGSIEIVPRDILEKSHIRIEYSRFGVL